MNENEEVFDPRAFVSLAELGQTLRLKARATTCWVAKEQIPRFALSGRAVRFLGADLNAALARAKVQGRTKAPAVGFCGLPLEEQRRRRAARDAKKTGAA